MKRNLRKKKVKLRYRPNMDVLMYKEKKCKNTISKQQNEISNSRETTVGFYTFLKAKNNTKIDGT